MNTITTPISFMTIEVMNKWYSRFEEQAISICRKYDVIELWDNARILKNEKSLEVAIVSLGAYESGSNTEKAVIEIVDTFELMFNSQDFTN